LHELVRGEAPSCLIAQAPGWTEAFVSRRQADSSARFSWRSQPCYDEARTTLFTMSADHCAFCDGLPGGVSLKTVEHFRPKSAFPEQAYDWHNLFPCCTCCQSAKGEKFDDALLCPDGPGYRFEDFFLFRYETGALEARPDASEADRRRANVTIELYGLNTAERRKVRLREIRKFSPDSDPVLDDYPYRFALRDVLPAPPPAPPPTAGTPRNSPPPASAGAAPPG
jgi:uncharacterized protein (TIGR02646 family)